MALGQTKRSMNQNRKSRNRPTFTQSTDFLDKDAQVI